MHTAYTGCTLKEDQLLRLLLNLFFYYFDRSEPSNKSQRIKLVDVIAACNKLNLKMTWLLHAISSD